MEIPSGFELIDDTVKKKKADSTFLSALLSLLIKAGIIAGAIIALAFVVFNIHTVSEPAMSPSVNAGDIIIAYRFDKDYSARDLCVLDIKGERQVRRVVATQGDTVDVTSEGLRVNGYLQQEDYAYGDTLAFEGGVEYPITLGSGEIFVLGDNRESSVDSRVYGPVKADETLGSLMLLLRRGRF